MRRLAVDSDEVQRREIFEMEWYVDDIEANGPAATAEDSERRHVPDFDMAAERRCRASGRRAPEQVHEPGSRSRRAEMAGRDVVGDGPWVIS